MAVQRRQTLIGGGPDAHTPGAADGLEVAEMVAAEGPINEPGAEPALAALATVVRRVLGDALADREDVPQAAYTGLRETVDDATKDDATLGRMVRKITTERDGR